MILLSTGVDNDGEGGVSLNNQQIYIPTVFMPPILKHKRIGKKLIRIIFEFGQIINFDVFVIQLTDSFKERLLKRGAIPTDVFDTLQIVEETNLLDDV